MLTSTLHPYQEEAFERALERGSMLIAYEMGLGKTVIALALAEELLGTGEATCVVFVVLASLKYQMAQEIAKHTDVDTQAITVSLDGEKQQIHIPTREWCVVIDGSPEKRAEQYAYITKNRPDYVVMSYENVVNDWSYVRKIKQEVTVLDEITAIKTFRAARTRKVKRLKSPYRYGMTGTPIENGKPEEIFSEMQWVDEDVLGRFDLFDKSFIVRNHFGGVQKYKNLPLLHKKLSDVMVRKRRLDPDVAPYLPDVDEKNASVVLDAKTMKAYRYISTDLLLALAEAKPQGGEFDLFAHYHGDGSFDNNSAQGKIMSRMQALDMLLDHPHIIVASAKTFEESERLRAQGVQRANWDGSAYAYEVWKSGILDGLDDSPKLDWLAETVEEILDSHPDNKILVFSYFREMLSIIQRELPDGVAVQYHGQMSSGEKAAAKAKFTSDPECRVFLSSHAGALGTDMYMANYLINYDLAWSSGKQDQINARHVRASSKFKQVYIINPITKGTTEARKYSMLALKRRIGSAITDNVGADDMGRIENDLTTLTEYLQAVR